MPLRTSRQPTPRGPWNLCADRDSISKPMPAKSTGTWPTACTASVWKERPFPAEGRQLRHRLEGADFIVGEHDGHESRVVPQGRAQVLHPDNAVFMYRQKRHFKALFFQGIEGVKDGVVFKRRGNQVPFSLFWPSCGRPF